jgi:hypothetical protein
MGGWGGEEMQLSLARLHDEHKRKQHRLRRDKQRRSTQAGEELKPGRTINAGQTHTCEFG